jgi:hypothetical protein
MCVCKFTVCIILVLNAQTIAKQYDSDGIFLCQKFCLRVTIKAQWRFLQPGGLESSRSDAPCSGHGAETEASATATGRWSVELWHTQGNKGKTWENQGFLAAQMGGYERGYMVTV